MKSIHKVERFDYSKIESRDDMRYFGIHPKSGRIHIDTKRYRKILEEDGITEFYRKKSLKIGELRILFQRLTKDLITSLIFSKI